MASGIQPIKSIDTSDLARKGELIYQQELKDLLEKTHLGKFCAIEVDSKDYFLGDTPVEASAYARKKYPDKVFYLVKIGSPAVYTMSNHFKETSYGSVF